MPADGSLTAKSIAFVEHYLRVPEGDHVGEPLTLLPFQRDIFAACYDEPRPRRVIVSIPRKNGKTTITAALVINEMAGPAARQNAQLYSAAQSRDQASLVFRLAKQMIRQSPELSEVVRVTDSRKHMECTLTGATYHAMSADATTAYGISSRFVVHDELGQVTGGVSELYDVIETSAGAYDDAQSVIISTQAPDNAALLSALIDDAKEDPGGDTRLIFYGIEPGEDPYDEAVWMRTNPSLGVFRSLVEFREAADRAQRQPAFRPTFQNLYLNARISRESLVFTEPMWMGCEDPTVDLDALDGRPCYAGLDLSSKSDLTSMSLCFPRDGWQCFTRSWVAASNVDALGESWNAPYREWIDEGWLVPSGGAAIDYADVAAWILDVAGRFDLRRMASDPARLNELEDHLAHEFSDRRTDEGSLKVTQSEFFRSIDRRELPNALIRLYAQTPASMEPAIGDLETMLDGGKLRLEPNPVTRWAARNTRVSTNSDGQRRPVKRSSGDKRWKIDPVVALMMSVRQSILEVEMDPASGSLIDSSGALDFLESLS